MHWGAGLFGECNNGYRALACTAARRKTGKKAPNSNQASLLPSTLSPRCGVCSEPVSNAFPTSRQSFQGFHAFAQQQQQCFAQTFPLVLLLAHSSCAFSRMMGKYLSSNGGCGGCSVPVASSVPFSGDTELVGASHGTHGLLHP